MDDLLLRRRLMMQMAEEPIDYSILPLTVENIGGSDSRIIITWQATGSSSNWSQIKYTKYNSDDSTTTDYLGSGDTLLLVSGEKAEFSLVSGTPGNESDSVYHTLLIKKQSGWRGEASLYGNLMSLFYTSNFSTKTTFPSSVGAKPAADLFHGSDALVSAKNFILPVTTLKSDCYTRMFQACAYLVEPPKVLPAKTIAFAAYYRMFDSCTALTTTPQILGTSCSSSGHNLEYMFNGCTSLVTAKDLALKTLNTNCCAYMFYGCTNLTKAPALPATSLTSSCYYCMFQGCSKLETAPVLPATQLVSNCYYRMFRNCSKLNYIKAMFTTTPSTSYTNGWVYGVASSGTFVKNSSATWTTTGNNGVPSNWTIETASS